MEPTPIVQTWPLNALTRVSLLLNGEMKAVAAFEDSSPRSDNAGMQDTSRALPHSGFQTLDEFHHRAAQFTWLQRFDCSVDILVRTSRSLAHALQ